MIERQPDRLRVTAPMVMANARGLLEAGRSAFKETQEIIDLGAVQEADSSALAVMLGWQREAESLGARLVFTHAPAGVRALAELYGVADLLPLA